jgi:hypothetical protein
LFFSTLNIFLMRWPSNFVLDFLTRIAIDSRTGGSGDNPDPDEE